VRRAFINGKRTESWQSTEEACMGKVMTSASGRKTESIVCYRGAGNQRIVLLSVVTLPFQGHIWLDLVRQ